jgi:sulfatase modifying factor 1
MGFDVHKITPTEEMWGQERPFYRGPTQPNRRLKRFIKWLQLAVFFTSTVLAYLLGLSLGTSPSSPISNPPVLFALKPVVDLVGIKGGNVFIGDGLDGLKDARRHQVFLTPYRVAKHEVTLELWEKVRLWGKDHGYQDLHVGSGKGPGHPVYGIRWPDAVKWCNALSEMEGLTPCYYSEMTLHNVARKGMADISNQHVNWESNGYRLPTEAEWEFAARGGLTDNRFPLGNEISHEEVNYHGSLHIEYDKCQREGTAKHLTSSQPYTSVVGSFHPNGFGLYDMAGNIAEWCWDFYDPSYGNPESVQNNPRGPIKGLNCVIRGGSWRHSAADARCASRLSLPGDMLTTYVGFRVVRSL